MARERFSGPDLSQELSRIQKRLDSVELLTPDIVMNLLLSYRDVQVCMCVWESTDVPDITQKCDEKNFDA